MSQKSNALVSAIILWLVPGCASRLSGDGGYLVEGVVVDSRSGAALAHMQVALASSKNREEKFEVVTKEDGRFSFAVSQPGKYTLMVHKAGYPPQYYKEAGFANGGDRNRGTRGPGHAAYRV